MIRHKERPEDFIVTELPRDDLVQEEATAYHIYLLEKRNYTTERAVTHIVKALHIPRKNIAYAGTKDKNAVTRQYITIKGVSKESVASLELKDITLTFKGYSTEAMKLGHLKGNSFEILVRGLPREYKLPFEHAKMVIVPNYFDKQRFSTANIDIGKAIMKKEYKQAVDILINTDQDWAQTITEHLQKQQNDYIGALRLLPNKTLLFFVHALQSKIYNDLLTQEIEHMFTRTHDLEYDFGTLAIPDINELLETRSTSRSELPLVGYESDLTREQEKTVEDQGLSTRNFINRSIPQLSLEGSNRKSFTTATDVKLEETINDDEKTVKATFTLPKGSYATIVLKTILAETLATEQSDL
ncbi:MAG: tRNA pseudouridine(13) synthase TruD [Nanobdellota archaeon]